MHTDHAGIIEGHVFADTDTNIDIGQEMMTLPWAREGCGNAHGRIHVAIAHLP